ncbi:OmpA family protein [Saprospiraceae bacterium]|nr:OmpA family protein [Saprospiraceae bacterium]
MSLTILRSALLGLIILMIGLSRLVAQITDTDSTGLEKDVEIIQYDHLPTDLKINDILVAKGNKIWAATNKGVYQLYASSSTPYISSQYTETLVEGRSGEIWAAGNDVLYNITNNTKHQMPAKDIIVNDIAYQGAKVWLATNKGIYTYNSKVDRFNQFTERNSKLKTNTINFIQVDNEDVIWAGTSNGYVRIKNGDWDAEDKGYDVLLSRYNKEGQWMVATDDMWLISNYNRKFPIGLDESLFRGTVNDFVLDGKGRLYMASNILVRYDPQIEKIEVYGAEVGMLAKRTLSLACDLNNNIWIGTENSGLFRIVFADIADEQLAAEAVINKEISCAGKEDASIRLTVTGGKKPYKYAWSDPDLSGKSAYKLKAGIYTVTVTDKTNTEVISTVEITSPAQIEISVVETQRISSEGAKDGVIEVAVSGGSGELSYKWNNGKTGMRITRLAAGQLILTVTDQNGCSIKKGLSVKKAKSFPTINASQLTIGQTLRINNLYFLADSSGITDDSYEVMDEVYDFLRANDNVIIEIGGHTNTIPSNAYCDKLSNERARNVANYLYEKGIPENRLTYKGYGKREPITQDRSTVGKRKNQRVEVKILSIQ